MLEPSGDAPPPKSNGIILSAPPENLANELAIGLDARATARRGTFLAMPSF